MRARLARFLTARSALTVWAAAGLVAITGCGSGDPPPAPQVSQPPVSGAAAGAAVEPRADLARRVAAAKDRRFTAAYAWTGSGAGPRTVTVTLAADGTWRVDIPGGAEGGRSGVSLVGRAEGVYQCTTNGCVRVARAAGTVPSGVDPKVHHPFTDWPAVLADPKAALSVTSAGTLPGVTGTCFSVEPTTVSIAPPIDPGIFCYGDDGMPTGVRTRFGTLALAGPPGAAPATADLAGPVSNAPPLSTSAPPAPSRPAPAARQRVPRVTLGGPLRAGPGGVTSYSRARPGRQDSRFSDIRGSARRRFRARPQIVQSLLPGRRPSQRDRVGGAPVIT